MAEPPLAFRLSLLRLKNFMLLRTRDTVFATRRGMEVRQKRK